MKLPRKPKPAPRQASPAFRGGLADRLPAAPPVEGEVTAGGPPLPPPRPAAVAAQPTPQPAPTPAAQADPMSWMQAVFANPPGGGANENVMLALQDQAIRNRTAPWMGRDQLAQLLAATRGA